MGQLTQAGNREHTAQLVGVQQGEEGLCRGLSRSEPLPGSVTGLCVFYAPQLVSFLQAAGVGQSLLWAPQATEPISQQDLLLACALEGRDQVNLVSFRDFSKLFLSCLLPKPKHILLQYRKFHPPLEYSVSPSWKHLI